MTSTVMQGYKDNKKQLLDRLKRVEGQVRGVIGMIEADRYCIDVITQISAAQAALDKVALGLLDDHAHHCVMKAKTVDRDQRAAELMGAVGRLLRRG
ncbi:MAG: metal-sensitive transcriptional regulator [Gammaproteobacteria bacterium]|nr:metal-sensitive transcriptional regulator [Gammaproteobacteria bacterium]